MDSSTILILAIVVGGIIIAIGKLVVTSQKKKDIKGKLDQLSDFYASQLIVGEDGESGIAIDEQRKKVCLIKHNAGNTDLAVISYKDLLASEIYEDGTSVTKTSRVSQAGSALVGGLLFGGVGAVVGGLTGKKSTSDKIKRIDLRLTVNRTQAPIHDVNFMNVEGKRGGLIYNNAIQKVRHWHGLIEVLIRRADEDDRKEENTFEPKGVERNSVADELTKLAKLKEQGILTDNEFMEQKAKVLSKA
ncbi:MAG: SHOCT domain-containing protein [Candidatus Methanoperedens sp.]